MSDCPTRTDSRANSVGLSKPAAHLGAHFFAKFSPARRAVLLADVMAVEHVEVFQDGMTVAGHRQNAQQFGRRPARARDLPAPDRIGAAACRETTKLRHVGCRELSADRVAKIAAELLQFRPGHSI